MIKIAICDDNVVFLKNFSERLSKYFKNKMLRSEIIKYSQQSMLLEDINTHSFDIIIMDIEFVNSSLNGIDIAKRINQLDSHCQVIFITAYPAYFIEVYEAEHVYLILKDDLERTTKNALHKALGNIDYQSTQNTISIKHKGETTFVQISRVIYLENILRKVKFHMDRDDVYAYAKFEDYSELLNSNHFVQCHRSFIINVNYIKRMNKNEIIMNDESIIPISRLYKKQLIDLLYDEINPDLISN